MIIVTPYTMDCQEVIGLNMRVNARTMKGAVDELGLSVIASTSCWILCGRCHERYLITDEDE